MIATTRRLIARPRPHVSLTTNALALVTGTIVTNGFGLAFWAVAAHLRAPAVVGRAAAAVAALTLLATLAQFNLTQVFVRLLPGAGRLGRTLVTRGYLVVVFASIAAGLIYAFSGLGSNLVAGRWSMRVLFVLGVPILAIFVLQDSVLTGLRLTRWIPVENVTFAIVKLALLPALVLVSTVAGIVLAWVVPAAVAVAVVSGLLFRRAIPRLAEREGTLPGRRRLLSFVGGEYTGQIAQTAILQLMPLIVLSRLGPAAAGYFTLPWMISMAITLLLWNVSMSFVVEVLTGHGDAHALLRRTLMLWAGLAFGALLVCVALPGPLLSLAAGPRYAEHGTELLRLIGLSAPFSAAAAVYWTMLWLDRRVWTLAAFQTVSGTALLAATLVLMPRIGLVAVGWANLGVQVAAAIGGGWLAVRRLRDGRPVGAVDAGQEGDHAVASTGTRAHAPAGTRERARTVLRAYSDRGFGRRPGTGASRRAETFLRPGTGRSRTVVTAYTGLAAGCLSAALILSGGPSWLSLIGALTLACVPPGAAVMCWVDSGEGAAQAGLTLVLSLTIFSLVSALMIWAHAWHPHVLLALAAAGIASSGARVHRSVNG